MKEKTTTIQICLFNPNCVSGDALEILNKFPVFIFPCYSIKNIQFVDTNIPVKRRLKSTNGLFKRIRLKLDEIKKNL